MKSVDLKMHSMPVTEEIGSFQRYTSVPSSVRLRVVRESVPQKAEKYGSLFPAQWKAFRLSMSNSGLIQQVSVQSKRYRPLPGPLQVQMRLHVAFSHAMTGLVLAMTMFNFECSRTYSANCLDNIQAYIFPLKSDCDDCTTEVGPRIVQMQLSISASHSELQSTLAFQRQPRATVLRFACAPENSNLSLANACDQFIQRVSRPACV